MRDAWRLSSDCDAFSFWSVSSNSAHDGAVVLVVDPHVFILRQAVFHTLNFSALGDAIQTSLSVIATLLRCLSTDKDLDNFDVFLRPLWFRNGHIGVGVKVWRNVGKVA